jgi:hypothetical protein
MNISRQRNGRAEDITCCLNAGGSAFDECGWPGHFPAEARAALSELVWPKVHAPLNRPPPPWSRCSGHRLAARTGLFIVGARGTALARSDNDLLRAVVGRARAPAAGEAQLGASTCGAAASPLGRV